MPADPKLDLKQCSLCRRVMTTSYFGSSRSGLNGLRNDCRQCVNLNKRAFYFKKHGYANPDHPPIPSTDWNMKRHNEQIVSLGLLRNSYACLGHDVVSHNQYRVEFSMVDFLAKIEVYDGHEKVATMTDGKADVHEFRKLILMWLYQKNIRLEKSDYDLHVALREIYFI